MGQERKNSQRPLPCFLAVPLHSHSKLSERTSGISSNDYTSSQGGDISRVGREQKAGRPVSGQISGAPWVEPGLGCQLDANSNAGLGPASAGGWLHGLDNFLTSLSLRAPISQAGDLIHILGAQCLPDLSRHTGSQSPSLQLSTAVTGVFGREKDELPVFPQQTNLLPYSQNTPSCCF